jgi:hypothetical protein
LPTTRIGFRVDESKAKAFYAFADRHNLSLTEGFVALVDAISEVEKTLKPQEAQIQETAEQSSDPKTGAGGSSLLSPTTLKEENRDSPEHVLQPAAPDPLPLEANSSTKQTASTIMSKTSNNGLSVGETSKISSALLERLRYQQLKAEIWSRSRVETEEKIQAVRETVRRYRNNDGRRAPVDYAPDKGEPDHGRPDFYIE